jgi:exodeoxyribonuclease VII small subunit
VPKEKTETFETLYARLEERVGKLEDGGLSLEEAIAVYEEGMTLARRCQEQLDAAELKITKLKEAFAAVPSPGATVEEDEPPEEYEYIDEDAAANDEEFP